MRRLFRKALGSTMRGRLLRLGLVFLVVLGVAIPLLQEIATQQRYRLDAATLALVGGTNPNLTRKLNYDASKDSWQFNGSAIKKDSSSPVGDLSNQLGGGGSKDKSLYAVDLPADSSKGVTYYDTNTQLSFTLAPQFAVKNGREINGRVVYPAQDDTKLVYTAKNNGMKEDVVIAKNIGNDLKFTYKMNLPNTLEARVLDDGSVGIYSADLALYGNINFSTDTDRAKVESARQNATKDNLVFILPPPVIKGSGKSGHATGEFRIDGDLLTVYANNMNNLTYPATVDPSVVITSTSDFARGNNESNIDFPSGQINRGGLTGATLGSWSTTNTFTTGRQNFGSAVYNGYLYVLGGYSGSYLNDVQYTALSSSGTVGSWATTTSFTTGRSGLGAVAYNGYLYVLGGYDGTARYNDVQYAKINPDGTVGSWSTTTTFSSTRSDLAVRAYNGYLYVAGGLTTSPSTVYNNDVQYAVINADGTVGTWASTTSFTTGRTGLSMIIYNNFMYILAGQNSGLTYQSDVQYAPINSNGTVGTWATTTSFTTARYLAGVTIYDGYLYLLGGYSGSYLNDVQYAPITANGAVGSWITTTAFTTARDGQRAIGYGGYVLLYGGFDGSVYKNDVQYSQISPAGVTGAYNSSGTFTTNRIGAATVAYNGYLYVLGGYDGSSYLNTVQYAAINSDGSLGSWAATSTFTTARAYFYAVAYNDFMYVIGGGTSGANTATVYRSAVASNGTLNATWTAMSSMVSARKWFGGTIQAGYLYALGGDIAGAPTNTTEYVVINADGSLGTWATSNNIANSSESLAAVAYGGYIYDIGGNNGGATYYNIVEYAPLNANGSIGTWTTTASFTTARKDHSVAVANGYMYIAAGQNGSGSLSDVQYAQINTNGSITSWATTVSASTDHAVNFGMVAYRGSLYMTGGKTTAGAAINTVHYAAINNGGGGGVGAWTTTASFNTARNSHSSVSYNNYIYIMGGNAGLSGDQLDVQYALVLSTGAIATDSGCGSAWCTSTHSLPSVVQNPGAVVNKGYIYVTGGKHTTVFSSTWYAKVTATGDIATDSGCGSAWCTTSGNLNTARYNHATAVYNDYIYVMGGNNGSTDLTSTEYAKTLSTGGLATDAGCGTMWCTTTSFSGARQDNFGMALNGYIYSVGGVTGSTRYNDAQYAPLNGNGTIGSWAQTSPFNVARSAHSMAIANGYLYLVAGNDGTNRHTDVQYTSVNANGTLGTWQHTSGITGVGVSGQQSVVANGYLIVLGGTDGTNNYATVQTAALASLPRTGMYSKLLTLSGEYALSTISYNGIIPDGLTGIAVKTANSAGVLGASQLASGLSPVTACTAGTTKYIWMSTRLDDTSWAVFPDVAYQANATDITLNIVVKHPSPNVRLRGGKFFEQEALQPNDTCGP